MASDTISQKEAHQLERRVDNQLEKQREGKSQLSELMGAAFGGFAVGYLVKKNPQLAGIGPGKKLHLRHVVAAAGIYLGRKKGRTGAMARGAGLGALFAIGEEYGARQATTTTPPPKS